MESGTCHNGWRKQSLLPLAGALLFFGLLFSGPVFASSIFINEFHYDNAGTDVGEGVEIAGTADSDLSDWSLFFYRDSGTFYDFFKLSGTIPNLQNGFGVLSFFRLEIQNGPADGIALIHDTSVVQFLSYEGTLKALDGPAIGRESTDVGVFESGSKVASSLQLIRDGANYDDFKWSPETQNSFGAINAGQSFVAPIPTPEPSTFALFGAAVAALALLRKRIKT
ncbi:MAG TPA: PEP-CTERM sorting domain-containing protein [Malonomonas sp.]